MKQLLVTKRNGNLEAINIDRIHKVLSHAADALGFDASEDDLESSYLDYAMRVIVGRSPSDPKVNVGKIEIQNYIFLLPYQGVVRVFVIATKNAPQNFSICDALFSVTTIQLLKASRRLARSPPFQRLPIVPHFCH
ncbi:TPA: hypothetical protein PIT40_002756 [Klebsiella quasipneumoniae subsp. similipneumoniae]|uniref:hypothetical protein n=1 Tax=Klebsiella quasipneumoniae TaxID=1463165 RepID=UPI0018CB1093|nr:hypothetical protein [Klebsiella quasipneumoniae]HBW2241912.1 hypothetical protein [Klebsiella quasipneumoniae subsp. similipneumoniae]MBG9414967.1 hypothetical protein [Klebsiella quasipneumoniae]HDE1995775.1 hypothetical protein [Klebsiella quasipneumoniae]HDG7769851.1 hypothetical protein [Klebsiella quasipneumoniae]HDH1294726.1 hypothetical protein [Klebsiella quasipneumoniae subsp. similipneumoniae]